MRIAICDSNIDNLREVKKSLYRYSNLNKIDFIVEEFFCGEELLKSKSTYFIIFIEYNLCGIDGLKTAKKLRENGVKAEIIFLSQNTDFIFESFKVSPYRFLTKPISQKILFETLNDFFNSHSENYPIWINNQINTYCLNTKDIVYLEADNKHCFVHLSDEAIPCNKTMAKVYSTLPNKYFIKINRAFIVNLNYISKYNSEYVFLNNGQKLHVSRNYYKCFKEEYINFAKPKIP